MATPQKLPWFPWIGKKRPFYGWVIVAMGTITWFANNLQGNGFTTYLPLLHKEFGWSRAFLAGPRSIMQLENTVLGPLEGFLVDRFGPRILITTGLFIMGLGLVLFGLIQSLWMFYAVEILIALGSGFASPFLISVVINHWFRRKRSMTTSLAGLGYGISTIGGIPLVVFMQGNLGWRTASMLTGFLIMSLAIPAALFLRRSPEPYGLHMDGEMPGTFASATVEVNRVQGSVVEEHDFTLRQALRTRTFWFMGIGQAMAGLGMSAMQVHLFLHLQQGVGLAPASAALVVSVTGVANVVSRLLGGYLGDRLPKRFIIGSTVTMIATAALILAMATSLSVAMAYAVLLGVGMGARAPVMLSMQGEYFGRKSLGIISGFLNLLSGPLAIAAPVVIGYVADVQGSYRPALTAIGFIVVAGAVLLFLSVPPKLPVAKENVPSIKAGF